MGKYTITVLPGDGVGQEVIEQAVAVLETIGEIYQHEFVLHKRLVGMAAIEVEQTAISDATLELCAQSDAILFGAVGGLPAHIGQNAQVKPEQALFRLRKDFQFFANLR